MTKKLPNLLHKSPVVAEMDELRFLRAAEHQEVANARSKQLKVIDAKYQPELDRLQKLRDQELFIQNKIINPYGMGYLTLSDDDIAKLYKRIEQIHANINH